MYILQLDPWKFWFFSNKVPGRTSQNREGLAQHFPARRLAGGEGKWGKMERGSRATLGWSWEERRWSELGSPRRPVAGGGTGRRWRHSGEGKAAGLGR